LEEEVDATGRYQVLWGNFANVAQAQAQTNKYLRDHRNVSSVCTPHLKRDVT